jgi:plasmid stability protein
LLASFSSHAYRAPRCVERRFGAVHDPVRPQNMKQLGKLGGRKPKMTALRRTAAEHDDSLREQARQVLAQAFAGEDLPKAKLHSARRSCASSNRPSASRKSSGPISACSGDARARALVSVRS